MPALIQDITGGAETSRVVLLQNAQLYRKIRDNNWDTLRIGVLLGLDDAAGAAAAEGATLALGLCSGASDGIGSETPGHWVGLVTWGNVKGAVSFVRTTAYVAGARTSIPFGNTAATSAHVGKVVGGVWTAGGTASSLESEYGHFWSTQDGNGTVKNGQKALFVTVTKGAPNYTVRVLYPNGSATTANAGFPVPRGVFLAQMDAATPSIHQHALGTARAFAVDEATDGTLDHVNIWWNRTSPGFWIDDISVVKLA